VKEQGGKLLFQIGFCHSVEVKVPNGIKVKIEAGATKGDEIPARFTLSGIDKFVLGQFAADVRRIRPPEPYKGKGIRYADEHVKRKAGKAFTSGTV
jgi:large subunit ribosomal protein L6